MGLPRTFYLGLFFTTEVFLPRIVFTTDGFTSDCFLPRMDFYHGWIFTSDCFLPRMDFYLRLFFTTGYFYHGKHGRAWKDTEGLVFGRGDIRRILSEHAPHGKARKKAELCLLLCNKVPSARGEFNLG